MAVNRIDPAPVRLSTKVTEARQTPNDSFGTRIQNGANATANVVASGAAVAAPFVPGGAIVSAAVSGVGTMSSAASSGQSTVGGGAGMVGASYAVTPGGATVPGGGSTGASIPSSGGGVGGANTSAVGSDLLSQMANQNAQYLVLQSNIQQESQSYMTLSNVLKTRHDTAKNSISNIH